MCSVTLDDMVAQAVRRLMAPRLLDVVLTITGGDHATDTARIQSSLDRLVDVHRIRRFYTHDGEVERYRWVDDQAAEASWKAEQTAKRARLGGRS